MISKKLVMLILILSAVSACATGTPQPTNIPSDGIQQDQSAPYLDIGGANRENIVAELKE